MASGFAAPAVLVFANDLNELFESARIPGQIKGLLRPCIVSVTAA